MTLELLPINGFWTVWSTHSLISGNSGPLEEPVSEAVKKGDLVCCGVLSGNRNFEGRIHPDTRANYLASMFSEKLFYIEQIVWLVCNYFEYFVVFLF